MSMKNNKGVTLVELLVTMTIVLLVGSALLGFFQISTHLYGASNEEVNLQYEAQTVINKIQDIAMDATGGISYSIGNTTYKETVFSDSEFKGPSPTSIEVTSKELCIFNMEDEHEAENKKTISRISWNKGTKELSYSKDKYESGVISEGNTYLLAQYVKNFELKLHEFQKSTTITLKLQMEKGTKNFETSTVIVLRNKVMLNKEAAEVFRER